MVELTSIGVFPTEAIDELERLRVEIQRSPDDRYTVGRLLLRSAQICQAVSVADAHQQALGHLRQA